MYKSKTSRRLGRAAVAAATLAAVALLPGVANATPLTAEATPATVELTCILHSKSPGTPIPFYNAQYGTLIGYVYDGQKINLTGSSGDAFWMYGVLWGRTDTIKVGSYWVYC